MEWKESESEKVVPECEWTKFMFRQPIYPRTNECTHARTHARPYVHSSELINSNAAAVSRFCCLFHSEAPTKCWCTDATLILETKFFPHYYYYYYIFVPNHFIVDHCRVKSISKTCWHTTSVCVCVCFINFAFSVPKYHSSASLIFVLLYYYSSLNFIRHTFLMIKFFNTKILLLLLLFIFLVVFEIVSNNFCQYLAFFLKWINRIFKHHLRYQEPKEWHWMIMVWLFGIIPTPPIHYQLLFCSIQHRQLSTMIIFITIILCTGHYSIKQHLIMITIRMISIFQSIYHTCKCIDNNLICSSKIFNKKN